MAEIDKLLVRIEAETAQLRRELDRAAKTTEAMAAKTNSSVRTAEQAIERLNRTKLTIGQSFTAAQAEIQAATAGMTARLGPMGAALTALGPAGWCLRRCSRAPRSFTTAA